MVFSHVLNIFNSKHLQGIFFVFMFIGVQYPSLLGIGKYLYCITFLRGTCDSVCFWIVDNHARKMVGTFVGSLLMPSSRDQTLSIDEIISPPENRYVSIDDYFNTMQFHQVSENTNERGRREESTLSNIEGWGLATNQADSADGGKTGAVHLDRIYGVTKE